MCIRDRWTVETIRLGHNASMGCKMVHTDAENYEGIYFLTDEEVLDAAARYRRWWDGRKYPRTMWTCLLYTSVVAAFKKGNSQELNGYLSDKVELIPVSYTHLDVYKRQVEDLEQVLKAAAQSPEQVLFITGMFPSATRYRI